MTTDPDCGRTWTGKRLEHCKSCHETFSGTSAGDMHRTGRHGVDRRCLTAGEMRERGMTLNQRNAWTSGGVSPWAADA